MDEIELGGVLHTGFASEVRLAQFEKRLIALKVKDGNRVAGALHCRGLKANSQMINSLLLEEVEALQLLSHPGIVGFESSFQHGASVCIGMEFIEGVPLQFFIPEQGLEDNVAKRLFGELCGALSYCHSQKVIHGNVNCRNVMISNGSIKLIDFGSCRVASQAFPREQHLIEKFGTIEYQPPYDDHVTVKWDAWALGIVLYCMVCGGLPFSKLELISNNLQLQIKDSVSEGAKEALELLLKLKSSARGTVEDALRLDWLVEMESQNTTIPLKKEGTATLPSKLLSPPTETKTPRGWVFKRKDKKDGKKKKEKSSLIPRSISKQLKSPITMKSKWSLSSEMSSPKSFLPDVEREKPKEEQPPSPKTASQSKKNAASMPEPEIDNLYELNTDPLTQDDIDVNRKSQRIEQEMMVDQSSCSSGRHGMKQQKQKLYAAESFWRTETAHRFLLQQLFNQIQQGLSHTLGEQSLSSRIMYLLEQCHMLSSELCGILEAMVFESNEAQMDSLIDRLTTILSCTQTFSVLTDYCSYSLQFGESIEEQVPFASDPTAILELLPVPSRRVSEWKTQMALLVTSKKACLPESTKEMLFQGIREVDCLARACNDAQQDALLLLLDV